MSEPHTHGGTDASECTTCRPFAPESPAVETLADLIDRHRLTTPVQCACGWRETDPDAGTWAEHVAEQVAAHTQQAVDAALGDVLHLIDIANAYPEATLTQVGRADGLRVAGNIVREVRARGGANG